MDTRPMEAVVDALVDELYRLIVASKAKGFDKQEKEAMRTFALACVVSWDRKRDEIEKKANVKSIGTLN
jgi:hypothetical protein